MKKSVLIAVLLFGFLASIVHGENSPPPLAKVPDAFRGAEKSSVSGSIGDLKWFEIFKDPVLQDLIKTTSVRNFDLTAAVARIDAERANFGIVQSNEYPQFTLAADGSITQISRNGPTAFAPIPRTRGFFEGLLNLLSFEIDAWGRLRHQTEAAKAILRASEEDRKTVMTIVVSDVASSYFSLRELDAELAIDEQTLSDRQDFLRLTKARELGGLASMLDVREAEQLVYSTAQTIPDTKRQIEQTENRIRLLLGENPGAILRGKSLSGQEEPPEVPAGLPSELLLRRPDIRSAQQNLIAQHALIDAAKAAYFPQISLTGFLGFQSSQLSNLFTGPSRQWSFLPQITQPLFTAGRLKSNVELAKANQTLALVAYQQAIKTAFSDVSNALIQYRRTKEELTEQEALVTALQERSRLAHARYKGGVDTLLSALDADRDLFVAQIALVQTKRNELLSIVQLYQALGGGWQL